MFLRSLKCAAGKHMLGHQFKLKVGQATLLRLQCPHTACPFVKIDTFFLQIRNGRVPS